MSLVKNLMYHSIQKNANLLCIDNEIEGIYHNGVFVKSQGTANHIIGPRMNEKSVTYITYRFSVACNSVLNVFSYLSSKVKYKLFKSYCMPLYGCIHWDLSNKNVEIFYKQWRKCVRKLFSISPRTHCDLLPLICSDVPIKCQLYKRCLSFYSKNDESPNTIVRLCNRHMIQNSDSNASKSIAAVAEVCHTNKELVIKHGKKYRSDLTCKKVYSEDIIREASFIVDLIDLRDSRSSNMSYDEISMILEYLCTK